MSFASVPLMAMSRSENMARIRSKDTKPELRVRRALHAMGYRFRLHQRALPGTPDIVFSSRKKVIFVHGCFWHQHTNCIDGRMPVSRQDYWLPKLSRTKDRDFRDQAQLRELGWDVLVIWECEYLAIEELRKKMLAFLGPPGCKARMITPSKRW